MKEEEIETRIQEAEQEGEIREIIKGRNEGKREGLAEGELKGKIETARNFLKMGLTLEQISQGTGLSIEEIERIVK